MNRENQPQDLKTIRIPPRGYLAYGKGPDLVIPVKPINDTWLLAPERTRVEINEVMQTRVETWKTSIESQINISGKAALLLTLAEMNFEYNSLRGEFREKADAERKKYEEEKQRIKKLSIGENKKNKLMKERWVGAEPKVVDNARNATLAENLQKMILSHAIMHMFSTDKNSDASLAVGLDEAIAEARKAIKQHPEMFPGLIKANAIDVFIVDLTSHLVTVRDKTLFSSYRYRKSSDLISVPEDCRILEGMIKLATTEQESGKDGELNRLGWAYLDFLVHRASSTSLVREGKEKYPHLQLFYDVVVASLYRGRGETSSQLDAVITRMFDEVTRTAVLQNECKGYMGQYFNNLGKLADLYFSFSSHQRSELKENIKQNHIENLPEVWTDWVIRTETRLQTLGNVTGGINSPAAKRIDKMINNFVPKRNSSLQDKSMEEMNDFYLLVKEDSGSTEIRETKGITLDLVRIWTGNLQYFMGLDTYRKTKMSRMADKGELNQLEPAIFLSSEKAMTLPGSEGLSSNELKHLEGENKKLWKEVLNNSKWFVSPRGDRFSANQDTELAEAGFISVTLTVDKQFPREHKIICLSDDRVTDIFWLDITENLLNENREIVVGDPRVKSKLENILLKRLYYIASGILSVSEDRELTEAGMKGKVLEYRRAYYALLKSTRGRRITMESHGAMVHAKEILDEYGIDIYKEIQRRREEGSLKQDEFITFVREVVPHVIAETARPNDINYDPTLITLV